MDSKGIIYGKNTVEVVDSKDSKSVVYAHPGDEIIFNFDISALKKTMINGDLVISTLSGGSITVANYSIMFMQGGAPLIKDSLSNTYEYNDLIGEHKLIRSNDNPDMIVIDRFTSTPDSTTRESEKLASGNAKIDGDSDRVKLTGSIVVDDQNPILTNESELKQYKVLTLFPQSPFKYDVPVEFSYTKRTVFNEDEDYTQIVKVRKNNPEFRSLYGTGYDTGIGKFDKDIGIFAFAGRGELSGDDFSIHQYDPEILNFSSSGDSIYYEGYFGDKISRGFTVYLNDADTSIQSIIIQNVPDGVIFENTDTVVVQTAGNGIYLVTPRTQSNTIDLQFSYRNANAQSVSGVPLGLQPISSELIITIDGYNFKFDSVIIGESNLTLDFRPVRTIEDILNYSAFNTFTYSTIFDPLIILTGIAEDYIVGGVTNHTYSTLDGNDIFVSNIGNDTVYLGAGDDTYIYDFGNDIVDGKQSLNSDGNLVSNFNTEGIDIIRFDHLDYTNSVTGEYTFNRDIKIELINGAVIITNNAVNIIGKIDSSVARFTHFNEIYLEDSEGVSFANNNTIELTSTAGFSNFIIHAGEGSNTLIIKNASLINMGGALGGYLTTVTYNNNPLSSRDYDHLQNVYFSLNNATLGKNDAFINIIGSDFNDYYMASINKDYSITFNGGGGINTIDYSVVADVLIYNNVSKQATSAQITDTFFNISVVIGTLFDDIFYGSGDGLGMIYKGYSDDTAIDSDLVSYENYLGDTSGNGVEINYVAATTDGYISVKKTSGTDKLYFIEIVKASQGNDRFILNYNESYTLDGLGGFNYIDYTMSGAIVSGISVLIEEIMLIGGSQSFGKSFGSIGKGLNNDIFSNISSIIGTDIDDVYNISGLQNGGMHYDARGGFDTIDYHAVELGLYILYNVSTGNLKKIKSSGDIYEDTVLNFETVIATSENDIFIVENKNWELNPLFLYNGGESKINEDEAITVGQNGLINAGNVVYLNYNNGSPFDIGLLASRFINFQTVQFGNFPNTVVYTNNNFLNYYGSATTTDTLDAANQSRVLAFHIKSNVFRLDDIKVYNFDTIIGASIGNDFLVQVTAGDVEHGYRFIGGLSGVDNLDYSSSNVDLLVDFGSLSVSDEGYVYKNYVQNGLTNTFDRFINIENFIGGRGDDYFLVNPFKPIMAIDGGDGVDILSFRNYTQGVDSSSISVLLYRNIETYELTRYDDVWNISPANSGGSLIGGDGVDRINIDATITSLNYDIGTQILLNVLNPSIFSYNLTFFEILTGTSSLANPASIDRVTVSNSDNSTIASANQLNGEFNLYFQLNNAIVDYTSIASAVKLFLFGDKLVYRGIDSNMYVSKDVGGDYYLGVDSILLSTHDDIIDLDLSSLDGSNTVNILVDAGGGRDTIDTSRYSISVVFDMALNTVNTMEINITNWEILRTGDRNDLFIIGSQIANVIDIEAGGGGDTVNYSAYTTSGLVFHIRNSSQSGNNINVVSDNIVSSTLMNLKDVEIIIGSNNSDTYAGSINGNYTFNAGSGNNDILDYENNVLQINIGIYASISPNMVLIRKSIETNSFDLVSGIEYISGTDYDDTFQIAFESVILGVSGGAGRDRLLVESDGISGFEFNFRDNILSGGGLLNNIVISSFEVLSGSEQDDIFILVDLDLLRVNGQIDGNGGNDTLNIAIVDRINNPIGLLVNLGGSIYFEKNADGSVNVNSYVRVGTIENLILGEGDDTIIFTEGLANITSINVGGGDNLLSFREINRSLSGTFTQILQQVLGNSSANIIGAYGLELTNLSDTLLIEQNEVGRRVDGGLSRDTINYSNITDNITLDLTSIAIGSNIEVTRGINTDILSSFEVFVLGGGADTVLAGGSVDLDIDGGGGDNLINYSAFNGYLVADFTRNKFYKITTDNSYIGTDTVANFFRFIDTSGNDIIYASFNIIQITSQAGIDTLDFSRDTLITSIEFREATIGNASAIMSTNRTMSINKGTADWHRIGVIVTTEGNDTFISLLQSNKDIVARGGVDTLNYEDISDSGIEVNYTSNGSGSVKRRDNSGGIDSFAGIEYIIGTMQDDLFLGLNNISIYNINIGGGVNRVSFTGSLTAMVFDIDASGNTSAGNANIITSNGGILNIGGTNYNDTFNVDVAALNGSGGINGEDGYDTLRFVNATSGVVYAINSDFPSSYSITGMEDYALTNFNDTVHYVHRASDSIKIDFSGGNNDVFNFLTNSTFDSILVTYDLVSLAGYIFTSVLNGNSSLVSMENVEAMNINLLDSNTSVTNVVLMNAGTSGWANYTQGVVISNPVSEINYTYMSYRDLATYNTAATGNITTQVFRANLTPNTVSSVIFSNVTATKNLRVYFETNVAISLPGVGAAGGFSSNITYNDFGLLYTDAGRTQTLRQSEIGITLSTINMAGNNLDIVANTTLFMYQSIAMGGAAINFSQYIGNKGNWTLNSAGTLEGSFNNHFFVSNTNSITFTSGNDNVIISGYSVALASITLIGGGSTGEDTVSLSYSAGNILNTISSSGIIMGGTRGGQGIAGTGGILINATNFDMIDYSAADGLLNNATGSTNIILSSALNIDSIRLAKSADNTVGSRANTLRNALSAKNMATDSFYYISFEQETASKTNRMMQVDYNNSTYSIEVNNVQFIAGTRGFVNIVKFAPLNTQQFSSIVSQMSAGETLSPPTSGNNESFRVTREYLHLDLQYWGHNSNNDARNNTPNSDVIDLSSWDVAPWSVVGSPYTMRLSFIRGDTNNDGLHYIAIGEYRTTGVSAAVTIKEYGGETIYLPQTSIFVSGQSAYAVNKAITLIFPELVDSNHYAAYSNYTGNTTPTYTIFTGSSGSSSTSLMSFKHFTTFLLDRNGAKVTSIANIGTNFATEGIYRTAKGHLYFDQSGSADVASNNADEAATGVTGGSVASLDSAKFSTITSGSYYFSWGSWVNQTFASSHVFQPYPNQNDPANSRESTAAFLAYMTSVNTGVGIVFSEVKDASLVGNTEGYEASVFYRMQGVNLITTTSSNDIFSTGKLFWNRSNGAPSGALANAATKTYLRQIDAGDGFDIFLDEAFSADTKGANGIAQRGTSGYFAFNPGETIEEYLINDNSGGGHMQRYYRIEASGDAHIKVQQVINALYGVRQNDNTDTGGTDGQYAREISRVNLKGFEKIQVSDYSTVANAEVSSTGYYVGVPDNASVTAGNNIGYREIDLGGRYLNPATGAINRQYIAHQTTNGNRARLQWLNSSDPKVDSALLIQDGWNGTNYTSVYAYKNFDWIDLMNSTYDFNYQTDYIFNTDFDFAKMNGKSFFLDNFSNNLPTNPAVNLYFQQSKYNYTVTPTNGAGSTFREYRLSEDGATGRSFLFRIYGENGSFAPNFNADAPDNIVNQFNISGADLYMLQQRGHLEDSEKEPSMLGYSNGSKGISSYGLSDVQINSTTKEDNNTTSDILSKQEYFWEKEASYDNISQDNAEWLDKVISLAKEDFIESQAKKTGEDISASKNVLHKMLEEGSKNDFSLNITLNNHNKAVEEDVVSLDEEHNDLLNKTSQEEEISSMAYALESIFNSSGDVVNSYEDLGVNKKKNNTNGGDFFN